MMAMKILQNPSLDSEVGLVLCPHPVFCFRPTVVTLFLIQQNAV
jgi:hypothetical protein